MVDNHSHSNKKRKAQGEMTSVNLAILLFMDVAWKMAEIIGIILRQTFNYKS